MTDNLFRSFRWLPVRHLVAGFILCFGVAPTLLGQSATESDALQKRMAHARALAAAHELSAASRELEQIQQSTTDDSCREVARIMLMGIYLEEADYLHASALLEESFAHRAAEKESSTRSYFALAGQAVNGARAHLERYRSFGINVSQGELPSEAIKDLDGLRVLLERVAEQARQISSQSGKATDGLALLEDVASVREQLARNEEERLKWKREFAGARQQIAASETRVSSSSAPASAGGGVKVGATAAEEQEVQRAGGGAEEETAPGRGREGRQRARVSRAHEVGGTAAGGGAAGETEAGGVQRRRVVGEEEARGGTSSSSSEKSSPAKSSEERVDTSNPATNSRAGAERSSPVRAVEVGSLLGKAVQRSAPSYPQTARNAHVSGVVMVYLLVDEKGAVAAVEQTSGPQLLRQAAVEAARKWKFRPTVVEGQPIRVTGYLSFNFTL